jgi:hypothetical protein
VNVGNTEGNTDPNTALTQELGRVVWVNQSASPWLASYWQELIDQS